MSRRLNDLDPAFRSLVVEFLARCTEEKIPILIVETIRTPEIQAENVAKGVSWTSSSYHLPQMPNGLSKAIDICPYESYKIHGENKLDYNADDPIWEVIGKIGEECGMNWGGRWKKRDLGHFETKQSFSAYPSGKLEQHPT